MIKIVAIDDNWITHMAYTATFDSERKLITVVQSGSDNNQYIALESMREVRLDPRFRSDYGILCDFRQGEVQLSGVEAMSDGGICKSFFPGQRVAYLITAALKSFAEQHIIGAAPEVEIRDFFDPSEAEAWLCASAA